MYRLVAIQVVFNPGKYVFECTLSHTTNQKELKNLENGGRLSSKEFLVGKKFLGVECHVSSL